jgi:hypothetical protein
MWTLTALEEPNQDQILIQDENNLAWGLLHIDAFCDAPFYGALRSGSTVTVQWKGQLIRGGPLYRDQ